MGYKTASRVESVYRVSYGDPWQIRAPSQLNRFDINDPTDPVFTVYTGETEEAAFAEVLAPLRPDLDLIASLNDMPCDPGSPLPAIGKVSAKWIQSRKIGRAKVRDTATVVDITSPETIAELRNVPAIAAKARDCRFTDVDESSLKASGPNGRLFTQTVAAHFYNMHFSGIRFGSRLGTEYGCIAGFIALSLRDITESEFIGEIFPSERVSPINSAFQNVLKLFGLSIA